MKIAILLATYNSEKYINEQINSLISQTYKDFTICIRDDGSSDKTIQIIKTFAMKHKGIKILETSKNTIGAKNNFVELLITINADYYMFCDHDDVWFPQKIEKTMLKMKEIEKNNPNKPVLIHTDLMVVNKELDIIENSLWRISKKNPELQKNLDYLSVSNCVTGCTVMINKKAKEIVLPIPKQAIMHDWWIALCVAKNGVIDFINEPMGYYRQHEKNAIGASVYKSNYLLTNLMNIVQVIKRNIKNYRMIVIINKNMSILKFIYFKLLFYQKRQKFI